MAAAKDRFNTSSNHPHYQELSPTTPEGTCVSFDTGGHALGQEPSISLRSSTRIKRQSASSSGCRRSQASMQPGLEQSLDFIRGSGLFA